ncbi:MAG: helix-turn-helix domain-containing protein [Oscillospiraceae bacterium]|nr:helix-turn-helix domain-containing protein [Oscillospiraceae bacterium]
MGSSYQDLLRDYPEVITMAQFYKICRISKRRASWLLQSGALPCIDSGKKTRRFQIRTSDVAEFLSEFAEHPERFAAPTGAFSSKVASVPLGVRYDKEGFAVYLNKRWRSVPDLLTANQAAELIGYNKSAVTGWVRSGKLEACRFGGRLQIAKCDLEAFFADKGFEITQKSKRHSRMLKKFIIEEEES